MPPPRIPLLFSSLSRAALSPVVQSSFFSPYLQQQCRQASILSSLSDNPGAYNKKIRRGRGPSSGKGKTSGRGHKGQKAHGRVPRNFNGGQTPDEVVRGKQGFINVFSVDMIPLNLYKVQSWIDQGRLDPSRPITLKDLKDSNCVGNIKDGVKLLARGSDELRTPCHIVISRASSAAIAAVEKVGGSVLTRYYTPTAIRRILKGRMDPMRSLQSDLRLEIDRRDEAVYPSGEAMDADEEADTIDELGTSTRLRNIETKYTNYGFQYRLSDPAGRKSLEYYRDPAHRGYLSHLVTEGQTPSLFFRAPQTAKTIVRKGTAKKGSVSSAVENRIW